MASLQGQSSSWCHQQMVNRPPSSARCRPDPQQPSPPSWAWPRQAPNLGPPSSRPSQCLHFRVEQVEQTEAACSPYCVADCDTPPPPGSNSPITILTTKMVTQGTTGKIITAVPKMTATGQQGVTQVTHLAQVDLHAAGTGFVTSALITSPVQYPRA